MGKKKSKEGDKKNVVPILHTTWKETAVFLVGGLIALTVTAMFAGQAFQKTPPDKVISVEFLVLSKAMIFVLLGIKGVHKASNCNGHHTHPNCDRYPGIFFIFADGALYLLVFVGNFFNYVPVVPENLSLHFALTLIMFGATKGLDIWGIIASRIPLLRHLAG